MIAHAGDAPSKPAPVHPPFIYVCIPSSFGILRTYDPAAPRMIAPRLCRDELVGGSNGVAELRPDRVTGKRKWDLSGLLDNEALAGRMLLGFEHGYCIETAAGTDSYISPWDALGPNGELVHTQTGARIYARWVGELMANGTIPTASESNLLQLHASTRGNYDSMIEARDPAGYALVAGDLAYVAEQLALVQLAAGRALGFEPEPLGWSS